MTITHSDFQKNYTCDTYDGDVCGEENYQYICKAIAYEIDSRTILDNGVPMVIRVQYLQVGKSNLGHIMESFYSTFGYLNGYDRNDAIKMVSQNKGERQ